MFRHSCRKIMASAMLTVIAGSAARRKGRNFIYFVNLSYILSNHVWPFLEPSVTVQLNSASLAATTGVSPWHASFPSLSSVLPYAFGSPARTAQSPSLFSANNKFGRSGFLRCLGAPQSHHHDYCTVFPVFLRNTNFPDSAVSLKSKS